MQATFSLPTAWPLGGGEKRNSGGSGKSMASILPFPLPFMDDRKSSGSAEGVTKIEDDAVKNGQASKQDEINTVFNYSRRVDAAHAQTVSVELQLKQAALENVLSDTMVASVHLQEQLAHVQQQLISAYEHIDNHVAREQIMATTLESLEDLVCKMQKEMQERLDVEELVGYRSYTQKREKEVNCRLQELQDENDKKDVIIREQASQIACLTSELELCTANLDVAVDDLKTSTFREWKKHRAVCMEIGGIYIDLNHKDDVGLTMDRSTKFGAAELGMVGIGLQLSNVFPFEVLAVHPDSRTSDGLPAIFHECDQVVAIEDVNIEALTRADVNGLLLGPQGTSSRLKVLRYQSGLSR